MKALRIAGINLALILAGVILAELIFGNWLFGPSYNVLNVPRNEIRHFDVSAFMEGETIVTYSRDKHGLRGDYGGDPSNIDVLVMGGSTANERIVDDRKTWVHQLQQRFRDAGRDITIINAAVDGQSTVGHVRAFDVWFPNIPGLRPRYILAYVGINDVVVTDTNVRKFDDMRSPDRLRRVRQYFLNHSALYTQFRRIRGAVRARRAKLVHDTEFFKSGGWRDVANPLPPEALLGEFAARLDAYARRLEILSTRIREGGAEPIFITQVRGNFRRVDGVLQQYLPGPVTAGAPPRTNSREQAIMDLFNQVTRGVCREMELFCVDLAAGITFSGGDFYDQVHTTPAGSGKIAGFLFDHLKDRIKPR